MSYTCKFCGKTQKGKIYPGELCQGCYRYFCNGGTVNSLPNLGEITHDSRGFVVCHICGRAYKRLGSHIKESHGMTIAEYKEKFGLCANSRTTERKYSELMRKYAIKNKMPDRLLTAGFDTRIKPGETHLRKGKQTRLQETLDKRRRNLR
jgi:hypothetical protein